MRDVKRIDRFMKVIQEIWLKYPDTRFNQLLHSLQVEFNQSKGGIYYKELWEKEVHEDFGIVSYRKHPETDLFYVEDEEFIKFLEKKLDEYNK